MEEKKWFKIGQFDISYLNFGREFIREEPQCVVGWYLALVYCLCTLHSQPSYGRWLWDDKEVHPTWRIFFSFFSSSFLFGLFFLAFTVHMRLSNLGNLILLIFQLYILLQKFNATVNITHPYLSFSILTRKPEISFKPKLGSSKYSMFLTNQTVEAWCMITLLCAICFWWQEVYISVGNCVAELQKLERKRTSSHRILLDYKRFQALTRWPNKIKQY